MATIPIIGPKLVLWVWGGYNVNKRTLSIFFSLHFFLPFLIFILIFLHIFFLHTTGRITPQKIHDSGRKVSFYEYFLIKDCINIPIIFFFYSIFFFYPWSLGDTENWIPANPIKRPVHIQPEWYFLFAYAILRRIPNKLGGVIFLLLRVLILFFLPLFNNWEQKNSIIIKFLLRFFFSIFFLLTWLGGCRVEAPFFLWSQIFNFFYFLIFFLLFLFNNVIIIIFNFIFFFNFFYEWGEYRIYYTKKKF